MGRNVYYKTSNKIMQKAWTKSVIYINGWKRANDEYFIIAGFRKLNINVCVINFTNNF